MPHSTGTDTPFDEQALREHLLSVAFPYAEFLRRRSGLVGILLYGSLSRGRLTPFSDIDLAVFYEGAPTWEVEHRLASGEKVDVIGFPLADVTGLLSPPPRSMDVGYPFSLVLQSLLLSGEETLLFDPTGELRRVKANLGGEATFRALNRVSLSDGYHGFYRPNRDEAVSLLERGDAAGSLGKAKWCGGALGYLLRVHTVEKSTRRAAERLGVPGFADRREELASIRAASPEAAEAVWAATQALWDYALWTAAEPLREHLRSLGVADPDRLEMVGEYDLFWPGRNLNELGRVMVEVPTALRWCRFELDKGMGEEALGRLWGCRGTQDVRHRWERLSAALQDTGYDCSSVIAPMLASPDFARLSERLDAALEAVERKDVHPEDARRALAMLEEMEPMVTGVLPLLSEEELARSKEGS